MRAEQGEATVTHLCKIAGITRKTFYKFKRRYDKALKETPGRRSDILQALEDNRKGRLRKTDERSFEGRFLQQQILKLVVEHPAWGPKRMKKFPKQRR